MDISQFSFSLSAASDKVDTSSLVELPLSRAVSSSVLTWPLLFSCLLPNYLLEVGSSSGLHLNQLLTLYALPRQSYPHPFPQLPSTNPCFINLCLIQIVKFQIPYTWVIKKGPQIQDVSNGGLSPYPPHKPWPSSSRTRLRKSHKHLPSNVIHKPGSFLIPSLSSSSIRYIFNQISNLPFLPSLLPSLTWAATTGVLHNMSRAVY